MINATKNKIILKEGNAGVYSVLGTLKQGESKTLKVSPNATYREYWFAADPERTEDKIILTSDDCMEYKEVTLVEEKGKISWTGIKNSSGVVGWFLRLLGLLPSGTFQTSLDLYQDQESLRLYSDSFPALVLSRWCTVDAVLCYIPSDSNIFALYGE